MLPRRLRLSRQDFSLVSGDSKARRANSPHFSVVRSAAAEGAAVTVSKKVSKTAVGRHLLKRRIRAILRPWYLHTVSATLPQAIVVYARPGVEQLAFPELAAELTELLRRST